MQNMQDRTINDLENAYRIIDAFREILEEEITPKMQIMFMTDDFQGLEAACGYLGGVIEKEIPRGIYKQLVITTEETRKTLADAYQACQLVSENVKENSDMAQAIMYLKSCFYTLLNKTYVKDTDIQDAIGNMFEICDYGLETLDTIESVQDNECDEAYLNTGGQRIHARITQLREAFNTLRPKMTEETIANETKERGVNDEE